MHFLKRQYWHLFLWAFVISQPPSATHVYTRLFCTVLLKKPLHLRIHNFTRCFTTFQQLAEKHLCSPPREKFRRNFSLFLSITILSRIFFSFFFFFFLCPTREPKFISRGKKECSISILGNYRLKIHRRRISGYTKGKLVEFFQLISRIGRTDIEQTSVKPSNDTL